MARRKRKSKNSQMTYDSKETATFIGLILLVAGIFFAISLVTITENDASLFNRSRNIFGDATIFASAFLTLAGLKLLGVNIRFVKTVSLIAQAVLVVLISGFLTSISGMPEDIIRMDPAQTRGGEVGYYVVRNIFGDTIPTEPATSIIIFLLILILIPIAASLSLSQVVEKLKEASVFLKKLFIILFGEDEDNAVDADLPEEDGTPRAARFGDFNNLIQREKPVQQDVLSETIPEKPPKRIENKMNPNNDDPINFVEGELQEDGLHQDALKYPNWKLPPLNLLKPFTKPNNKEASLKQNGDIIEQILASFNIEAKVEDSFIGPSVVQYALNIPLGIKVSKIATLSENIALALGVDSKAVRIESIPETTYLGIEVPRQNRDMVRIKELMSSREMQGTKSILPVPIGKSIGAESIIGNITKMPHLLIAGATGSGKSVLTNCFITSLIMNKTPDELRMILVDPKQVELMDYNGIAHLLTPVITDMDKVVNALKWAVDEMENRYGVLAKAQVRNIEGYNEKKGFAAMPYIVIVIDEMADMMMTANRVDAENAIVRLAQKARAVGIHLILATQRPSVNVITGIIKANIPGRIGMSVTSSTDSRVILDRIGAESLMGQGDLLYKAPDKTKSERLQSAFIEQQEVIDIVDFIKNQAPEVEYITEITEKHLTDAEATDEVLGDISGDDLVEQAIQLVVRSQKGSSSFLQRRLSIGFNRAARLLEELEEAGVVGPPNGSKPREVLITDADSFIAQLKANS